MKTQEVWIESFRHRHTTADIRRNKQEVEQFTQINRGSVTPGTLGSAFPCGPWGPGGKTNPCPPRDTPQGELSGFDLIDFSGVNNSTELVTQQTGPSTLVWGDLQPGWLRRSSSIGTLPVHFTVRAENATGGFLFGTFEGNFQTIVGHPELRNDLYSGAFVVRTGFKPSLPINLFQKFTWVDLGASEGNEWEINLGDQFNSSRRIQFSGPDIGNPSFPLGSFQIDGSSIIGFPWFQGHEYSLRVALTSSSFSAKVWLTEEPEPDNWTLSGLISTAYPTGGYRVQKEVAWDNLGVQQLPGVVKISYIEVNGVAFLDCDSVNESDGSVWGSFDPFGFLQGLDELVFSKTMTGVLTRITESRFAFPGPVETVMDVRIDGVHAEPGEHYEFVPPDIITTTNTLPVGVQVSATWVARGDP